MEIKGIGIEADLVKGTNADDVTQTVCIHCLFASLFFFDVDKQR